MQSLSSAQAAVHDTLERGEHSGNMAGLVSSIARSVGGGGMKEAETKGPVCMPLHIHDSSKQAADAAKSH
jgi:hypothetical protein